MDLKQWLGHVDPRRPVHCALLRGLKRAGRKGHISRLIFTHEVKIVMAVVYGHFVVAKCKTIGVFNIFLCLSSILVFFGRFFGNILEILEIFKSSKNIQSA